MNREQLPTWTRGCYDEFAPYLHLDADLGAALQSALSQIALDSERYADMQRLGAQPSEAEVVEYLTSLGIERDHATSVADKLRTSFWANHRSVSERQDLEAYVLNEWIIADLIAADGTLETVVLKQFSSKTKDRWYCISVDMATDELFESVHLSNALFNIRPWHPVSFDDDYVDGMPFLCAIHPKYGNITLVEYFPDGTWEIATFVGDGDEMDLERFIVDAKDLTNPYMD